MLFSTQISVTKELDGKSHKWLKALSGNLKKDDICELLDDMAQMTGKADKEFANSVLEVSIEANIEIVEELRKGDGSMNAVLMEMMRPELQASRIRGAVETLKELGFGNDEIEAKIMKSYGIDEEEAGKYIQD